MHHRQQRTTKKKTVTRTDLDELMEQSLRTLEMACGQRFAQMMEAGEIEKHAKERGLPYQDAFQELQDEAYAPLAEAQLERSGRAPVSGTPVMTEEEERKAQGFTNREVEWRAKSRGIPYREAFNQLSDEHAAEEAVELEERTGSSSELLDEQAERQLDEKARAYAQRHGCSYPMAFRAVMEGR